MTLDIKDLNISNDDICLSSTIYQLYKKDKNKIYIRKVIEEHELIFKERVHPNNLVNKLKEFKERGFIKFRFKNFRGNYITKYIQITDKFLMFHKLSILLAMLLADENEFHKVAEPTLKQILKYLKVKYPKEKK